MVYRTERGDVRLVGMDATAITVRPISTQAELKACVELQRDTWGDDFVDIVPASILKVSQRIGGVALGAFDVRGELLGFVFGLTGVERGRIVHWSDMLAVRPEARNLGLGRRLKEQQRALVRELGASVIYWTYDPLVARNAHLNFNRLGVRLAEYVEDMYGMTDSVLHGGMPTDRMIVAWPTDDADIAECLDAAQRALSSSDCRQATIVSGAWIDGVADAAILPHCIRVEIPANVEPLFKSAPADAARWRQRARRGLQWGLRHGYTPRAFQLDLASDRGYYLMTRNQRTNGKDTG